MKRPTRAFILDFSSHGKLQEIHQNCRPVEVTLFTHLTCGDDIDVLKDSTHGKSKVGQPEKSSHGSLQIWEGGHDPKEFQILTGIRCATGELEARVTKLLFPMGTFADPVLLTDGPFVCGVNRIKYGRRKFTFPVGTLIGPEYTVIADCCNGSTPLHVANEFNPLELGNYLVSMSIDQETLEVDCDHESQLLQAEFDSNGNLVWVEHIETYEPSKIVAITWIGLTRTRVQNDCADWKLTYRYREITLPAVTFLSQEVINYLDCCFCCDEGYGSSGPLIFVQGGSSASSASDQCPSPPCPDGWVQTDCCEDIDECTPEDLTVSILYTNTLCSGSETFPISYNSVAGKWTGQKSWTDECGNTRSTSWELECVEIQSGVFEWQLTGSDSIGMSGGPFTTNELLCCAPDANFGVGTLSDACPTPGFPQSCDDGNMTVAVTE